MERHIPIFAHRGASSLALENTFKAFEKARKYCADGIEIDVQRTKDDVLVVYHDLDLFRLTGVPKKIDECTYDELCQLKIGKNALKRKFSKEKIPTLQQVLDWANDYNMPLNIELKESLLAHPQPLVFLLQGIVLPYGSHFSSFHEELLRIVKMQRVDFETAFIITRKFDLQELPKLSYIDAIHAHKRYYKPKYIEAVKQNKKGFRIYSITGKEAFLKNPDPSVTGWITDYPQKVAKACKSQNKKTFKKKEN